MKKIINLVDHVSNYLFDIDVIFLPLTIIRKLSFFFAYIWEFTQYNEHYAAYLIFGLVWFMCHLTAQILKKTRINYRR